MESAVWTVVLLILATVIAFTLWHRLTVSKPKRKKRSPRPYRTPARDRDEDEPYESPLGFVDDPEDEWIEYAIMDDMLNDGW